MAIQGAAPEPGRVTAHLIVPNTNAATAFYEKAFGAKVLYLAPLPNGENMHAHLRVADSLVMLTQEDSDKGKQLERTPARLAAPQTLGGTTTILELYVDDSEAWFQRAVDAGATPTLGICDSFWGDRMGWVTDPFGHVWSLSSVREVLTPQEVQRRMEEMYSKMGGMH